jgi:uncharacterized protein
METWDSVDTRKVGAYGKFLIDVFDEWARDDDPMTHVRTFQETMHYFAGNVHFGDCLTSGGKTSLLMVIASDGEITEDDPFKVINFAQRGGSVFSTSVREFAESKLIRYIQRIPESIPTECADCCWQNFCRGGSQFAGTVNRYSASRDFNGRSVFCNDLKALFAHISGYMIRSGLSPEQLSYALEYSPLGDDRYDPLPPMDEEFFSGPRKLEIKLHAV